MQVGFYVVTELTGEDAQGAAFMAKVKSQMNAGIRGTLFLPPYLRPNQCKIDADSVVFGCLDEVTGRGFAIFGQDDADYGYFMDANLELQKTLTVNGATALKDKLDVDKDIKSSNGDVKAGTISLQKHKHAINAAKFSGTIDPTTGTASGKISGDTEAPS